MLLVRMNRRRVGMRHKATPAAGFVHTLAPDRDAFFRFKSTLRIVGWLPAFHADRMRLGDVLGDGEQLRHRFPGFAGVILIETRNYHSDAALSEFVYDRDKFIVEKLGFVDANNLRIRFDPGADVFRSPHEVRTFADSCLISECETM